MARKKRRILIVGTGTIGEPLIHLFAEQRKEIGIDEVIFHKRSPLKEEAGKVKAIISSGAELAIDNDKAEQFKDLGLHAPYRWDDSIRAADVIIDCTPQGNKLKELFYSNLAKEFPEKGFIAQGSEEGFGAPYVWTANDQVLDPQNRWIQVVSCNTHQLVCALHSLVLKYEGIENLRYGHFTIVRRASDISEDKGILGIEAEAANPKYKTYGSHQAYDAARILKTIYGEDACVPIFADVLKAPTQYMHTMLFEIEVKSPTRLVEVWVRLKSNPLVVFTHLKSTNRVLDRARNTSKIHGRILNQTVFFEDSLNVSEDGTRIRGTCFTPQDGNALLSSIAATLWLLDPKTYKEKMKAFDKFLFTEV